MSGILLAVIYLYSQFFQSVFFKIPSFLIVFGVLLGIILLLKLYRGRVLLSSMMTKELWFAVAFLAISSVSGFAVALSKNMLIDAVLLVLQGTALMIILSYEIRRSGHIDWIINIIIIVAFLQAISLILYPTAYTGAGGRYSIAEDVNPNGLAISLAYGAFFALYKLKKANLFSRYIWLSSIVLFIYCIIQTGSRKGFSAIVLMVVLWIVFCWKESQKDMTFFKKCCDFLIVITILVFGVIFTMSNMTESTLLMRLEALFSEGNINRENLYILAWETFKSYPLTGIGVGNYRYYFGTYSHATYAEIIACTGLLGTILYTGIWLPFGLSLKRLWERIRYNNELAIWSYDIKMLSVLLIIMFFYGTCIIHFYQVDSYFILGIMLGWRELIKGRKLICLSKHQDHVREKQLLGLPKQ